MNGDKIIWRPPNWPEIKPKADEELRKLDIDVTPKHQGIYQAGVEAGAEAILREGCRLVEGLRKAKSIEQVEELLKELGYK